MQLKKIWPFIILIAIIVFGITLFKSVNNVKGLLSFNEKINSKFPDTKVNININNNKYIYINFVKEHPKQWTQVEKDEHVAAAKEFILKNLEGIKSGNISFLLRKNKDNSWITLTIDRVNLNF